MCYRILPENLIVRPKQLGEFGAFVSERNELLPRFKVIRSRSLAELPLDEQLPPTVIGGRPDPLSKLPCCNEKALQRGMNLLLVLLLPQPARSGQRPARDRPPCSQGGAVLTLPSSCSPLYQNRGMKLRLTVSPPRGRLTKVSVQFGKVSVQFRQPLGSLRENSRFVSPPRKADPGRWGGASPLMALPRLNHGVGSDQ